MRKNMGIKMRILFGIIFVFVLVAGCSSQNTTEIKTETVESTKEAKLPNGVRQEIYEEALELQKIIEQHMNEEKVLDETNFKRLTGFAEKYTKEKVSDMSEQELVIRDSLLSMGQSNLEYVIGKLNGDIVKVDKNSKEYAFQLAKLNTLMELK